MSKFFKAYKLRDYINEAYEGSQAAFARDQGVQPAQVTQWMKKDFVVIAGHLYSVRRKLK